MPTTLQTGKKHALSARSVATRAKLVAVAERLFAIRGVEGVSLNEINRAAGQRNATACQYHFGNKSGLLQAIIDKHVPGIAARRNEMLDQLETDRAVDLRTLVRAWVYPVAEKLYDADGGTAFIRVNAQLTPVHTISLRDPSHAALRVQGFDRLARALNKLLRDLPNPVREQRLVLAATLLFHGLADHSRIVESMPANDPRNDTELFVHTLEDSISALLAAPLSSATNAHLQTLTEN